MIGADNRLPQRNKMAMLGAAYFYMTEIFTISYLTLYPWLKAAAL